MPSLRILAFALNLAPAAALLVAPAVASAQAPATWPAFARSFQTYVDSDRVVGASVVLMRNGHVVARHDAGHADRTAGVGVNEQTIYHWGSITKGLTAISLMQLRDRGKLSLDDKLVRWVPELRSMHDPYGMMDSITLRMVLSHTAGFQNAHLALRRWKIVGTVRADDVEPARGDDAVSGARLSARHAVWILESRFHLSRAGHRASYR